MLKKKKKESTWNLSSETSPYPTMIKFDLNKLYLTLELRILLPLYKIICKKENKLTGKFIGKSMSSSII